MSVRNPFIAKRIIRISDSNKIFALLFSLCSVAVFGQQLPILFSPASNGQTFVTCNGFVIDSGGQGGAGYSNNENFTITICPDTAAAGDNSLYITVTFNLFLLNTTNTGTQQNPNLDNMTVYDGPNATYPTLGTYNGNQLQNVNIAATNLNGTGCLTFRFYSNAQGTGQFTASATCTEPCTPPTADAFIVDGDTNDSIRVCLGEAVTLDGSASYAGTGFNIAEYSWNFMDGTVDNTTGAVVTHSFQSPGQYQVQLVLTDNNSDNPCQNLNVTPLKVYVSNYPTFNAFPSDTIICLGESLDLIGIIDFGQYDSTWVGFPTTNIVDDGCLSDQLLGVTQSIPITYTEFDPSDVITSVDDINAICMNMEHSFMGDLVVQLVCPNGTSINLQTQGGGGTQIGVPDQLDNVNCNDGTGQGEGWDYCWTANATQTWTEWVNAQGGFGLTLPEGNYASVDPLSNLIGCPLSGTWQINFTDNWAADDGTVFEFGVTFDPSFYPEIVEFTNTIGESADSSFWDLSDPYISANTPDLNVITITPTVTGAYSYNYHVVNNFGCEFDSTVIVTVVVPPVVSAGPDIFVCEDPVQLEAAFLGGGGDCGNDSGNYTYCYADNQNLIVTYCPDSPGDGVSFMEFIINSGNTESCCDEFYVYDGDNTGAPLLAGPILGNLEGLSFGATNSTGCITFQITPDGSVSCASGSQDPINISVSCNGSSGLVWSWNPPTGLSDPNIQNPEVLVSQATVYTLSVYQVGMEGCVATDQVLVAPDPTADPGIDADTTFCYNSSITNLTSYLGGTPALNGTWTDLASGQTLPNSFNPTQFPEGLNLSLQYEISNGFCTGTSLLNITILPASNNTCCQTNAFAGQNAVACDLTYQLNGSTPVGVGTWTGPDEVSFSDINDPNAIATYNIPGGGQPILTWTDSNGAFCEQSSDVQISFSDPLTLVVVPSDAVCFNQCSGTGLVIPDGGTVINGTYNYIWSSGAPGSIPQLREEFCTGVHKVVVSDNLGCTDSLEFVISQPTSQEIFTTLTQPLCADSCNGTVTIQSAGAVKFSFDKQFSWIPENVGFKCAGTDTVYARNAVGCVIGQSITLNDPPLFTADFNLNPTTTTTRNTLISFQDISGPGPLAVSDFTFGNDPILATSTNTRMTTFRFPSDTAGVYPITLISANINGCTDTISRTIIINDDILWYIPNSFSANGDGINDIWRPVGNTVDVTNYRLEIFDRWGKKVFESTDFDEGWNGAVEGSSYYSDAGLFTYIIKLSSLSTEEKYEFTGFITLLR